MRLRLPFIVAFALLATGPTSSPVPAQEANDKSHLITVAAEAQGGVRQIITFDLSGRQTAKLLEQPNDLNFPDWSDGNRRLVFVSGRSGRPQIHRIDADGTNQTALTQTASDENHPRWRPDGKQIAFASNRATGVGLGAFHIWVMDADGRNARQLVARDLNGWVYPSWSPDGAQILFSDRIADGSWQIFVANVDGRAIEQLTEGAGANCYANWSPDGRYFAYLHFAKPMNQSPGFGRLMLYDTETATHSGLGPDDVKCNGSWPAWRRDQADRLSAVK